MDFFKGQETLTTMEWILRALVGFVFLVIVAKEKVALAIWEADGKISVFLDPIYNPLTPADYQMKTEPFDLPQLIIKDGKIETKALKLMNKDEDWVISSIERLYQTNIKDVLLATLDNKENLKIFSYK